MAKNSRITEDHRRQMNDAHARRLDAEHALAAARAEYNATIERVYVEGGYSTFAIAGALGTSHQRAGAIISAARVARAQAA